MGDDDCAALHDETHVFERGDKDRAALQAIGESDRMTLRFRKPSELGDGEASAEAPAQPATGG